MAQYMVYIVLITGQAIGQVEIMPSLTPPVQVLSKIVCQPLLSHGQCQLMCARRGYASLANHLLFFFQTVGV